MSLEPSIPGTEEEWHSFYTFHWWKLRRGQRKKMVGNGTPFNIHRHHSATVDGWLYRRYHMVTRSVRNQIGYDVTRKWSPPLGSY